MTDKRLQNYVGAVLILFFALVLLLIMVFVLTSDIKLRFGSGSSVTFTNETDYIFTSHDCFENADYPFEFKYGDGVSKLIMFQDLCSLVKENAVSTDSEEKRK